ncbi:DEAD/DEAH box helicase [Ekhidna sp. To15]|uniref:DEAD/DEAH box helicase n=1 Tax=Ekhidna sp. To15 TaxID=3395267 RepID=UPI003F51EECF
MNNLAKSIFESSSFSESYEEVLLRSVRRGFDTLVYSGEKEKELDWSHLISLARILQESEEFHHLDASLRITQHCLNDSKSTDQHKLAAAIVLEGLTNKPAIQLAIKRNFLEETYLDKVPLPISWEIARRNIEYSIFGGKNEIISLNKFQKKVYNEYKNQDLISISAPTSAGKSFILERILLEEITKNDDILSIVFIVPSRALISQVEQELKDMFADNEVEGVYISTVPQFTQEFNQFNKRVLVFTQERLHWFKTEVPDYKIDILVVDEAHKISDGTRGILLQQKLEELFVNGEKGKVYFSSPFTSNPGVLLELFPQINNKAPVQTEYVSVNQNLIFVTQKPRKPKVWELRLATKTESYELGEINLKFRPDRQGKKFMFIVHELSDQTGGNLIYANGPADAEKYSSILFDLLENIEDEELDDLIDLASKIVHKSYALTKVLKRGVAFHYGNMPLIIRTEIERLFKINKIKYLVCTSTLLEGVNLPAKSIFIRRPTRGPGNPMDASDFWNLAGRAGRWGKEFQGNVICIEPSDWDNPPNPARDKIYIKKAVDGLHQNKAKLIQFIKDGTPRTRLDMNLEYGFSYFYSKYLNNNLNTDIDLENELLPIFNDISEAISIPKEIILRNPGISPIAQQRLLEEFQTFSNDYSQLIPEFPESEDAAINSYEPILSRINRLLSGDPETLSPYQAILVVNWMNGYPLSTLIESSYRYWIRRRLPKTISNVIRQSMKDVEEFARFKFAKYSGCYIDILRHLLRNEGKLDLIENIPELNIWLEFGVSRQTQVSLISLGLSRNTSIMLSEFIADDNLSRSQCVEWLMKNDFRKLDLSPIIIKEIEKAIKIA